MRWHPIWNRVALKAIGLMFGSRYVPVQFIRQVLSWHCKRWGLPAGGRARWRSASTLYNQHNTWTSIIQKSSNRIRQAATIVAGYFRPCWRPFWLPCSRALTLPSIHICLGAPPPSLLPSARPPSRRQPPRLKWWWPRLQHPRQLPRPHPGPRPRLPPQPNRLPLPAGSRPHDPRHHVPQPSAQRRHPHHSHLPPAQ